MKKMWNGAVCMLAAFLLLVCGSFGALAMEQDALDSAVQNLAEYLYQTVPAPQVGSTGGEWAVLGLARSGYVVPEEYYQNYYRAVEDYVKECGGILHDKKYTEYSRVVVALTAIGKNPADVAGYSLLTPLGDYDKIIWQGLNGPIWALIALDSGNYKMPQNPDAATQATREMYINRILECQLADGGWSLHGTAADGGVSDPDITGMALAALANYQEQADVKQATERALACMSAQQKEDGGFTGGDTESFESSVQMLIALTELGIPLEDTRFVKNGNTLLDYLMTYDAAGKGFKHMLTESSANQMATEQGFCALVAAKRALEGKNSLYRMTDRLTVSELGGGTEQTSGLPGKHADVQVMGVTNPGKTFADVQGHQNQTAVETLAARGIINGKSDDVFAPDETMTRAEFAAIIVRGLGLSTQKTEHIFADVAENDWFCAYVHAAYAYGVVNGVSETEFAPNGSITREQVAVMTARAAGLCGIDTSLSESGVRDALSVFTDYRQVSGYAKNAMAFCLSNGILDIQTAALVPQELETRAELADGLFGLLNLADLL